MKLKRFWPLAPAAFLAVPLALSVQPAAALPLVPNPITTVAVDDDSTRGVRVYTGGSCTGKVYVITPGQHSQAYLAEVNSFRYYEDSHISRYKISNGDYIPPLIKKNATNHTGGHCYPSVTNGVDYRVFSYPNIVSATLPAAWTPGVRFF